MNKRAALALAALLLSAPALPAAAPAPAPKSDILPANRRQQVVDRAAELARPPEAAPAPAPTDLPALFNPPDFDKPDAEEAKPGTPATPTAPGTAAPPAPPARTGDREILEALAARLVPSGTFVIGGAPQLVIGQKRFQVGTRFVVSYNNQEYELELVSIDRTTFTLRYGGEEITRPIKPVR